MIRGNVLKQDMRESVVTKRQVILILVKLGIHEAIAACMVVTAHNMGKYAFAMWDAEMADYRHYIVHHGMRGNITHIYSIEIS